MHSKYDTNPLDPDFPEKAKVAGAGQSTRALPYSREGTNGFSRSFADEEPTRKFAAGEMGAYGPPYNGQYVPDTYQPGAFTNADRSPKRRKVDKIGLPENLMVALPYFPFWIGLVASILELLFVPKHETKVRFHAAQGMAAHVGILLVTTLFGIVGEFVSTARVGYGIFTAAATIMLIIFAVKAWKGKPVHIESIEALTNWFEEKIKLK